MTDTDARALIATLRADCSRLQISEPDVARRVLRLADALERCEDQNERLRVRCVELGGPARLTKRLGP